MKEHSLRVLKNRMLRMTFGGEREKQEETGENCIMWRCMISVLHQI
jgi:hypothetical protein